MEKVCIYFSGTNSTKTLMDYFHEKIHFDKIINITNRWERDFVAGFYELIFIFFPIYGQTIPRIVFDVLKKLRGKNAVICVTYGGINYGNGLYKASNILKENGFNVIGGAIISTKHSYLNNSFFNDYKILDPLINKIKSENFEKIIIPRKYQNPLAKIFPNLRTRLGTKILIDKDSCKGCRKCITLCPAGAITDDYKVTKKCIRCLRCVETCKFITYQKNFFLKLYLKLFFKQRKSYIYY